MAHRRLRQIIWETGLRNLLRLHSVHAPAPFNERAGRLLPSLGSGVPALGAIADVLDRETNWKAGQVSGWVRDPLAPVPSPSAAPSPGDTEVFIHERQLRDREPGQVPGHVVKQVRDSRELPLGRAPGRGRRSETVLW